MNKKELVECIAEAADISKAAAEKALNGTLAAIADTLKKGHPPGRNDLCIHQSLFLRNYLCNCFANFCSV